MSYTAWMCTALQLIKRQDSSGLEGFLRAQVPQEMLIRATRSHNLDHVKLGCVCLSLVGDGACQEDLVACLRRGDKVLSDLAEHALWSVWFRSGPSAEANELLAEAVSGTSNGQYQQALKKLDEVISRWPTFSEAYNQRAIVHFLASQYEQSVADCQTTLRLNPRHFGAMAGLGHCHAHAGRLAEALACYEAALTIHPDLDCIRAGSEQIQMLLDRPHVEGQLRPTQQDIYPAEHI